MILYFSYLRIFHAQAQVRNVRKNTWFRMTPIIVSVAIVLLLPIWNRSVRLEQFRSVNFVSQLTILHSNK